MLIHCNITQSCTIHICICGLKLLFFGGGLISLLAKLASYCLELVLSSANANANFYILFGPTRYGNLTVLICNHHGQTNVCCSMLLYRHQWFSQTLQAKLMFLTIIGSTFSALHLNLKRFYWDLFYSMMPLLMAVTCHLPLTINPITIPQPLTAADHL